MVVSRDGEEDAMAETQSVTWAGMQVPNTGITQHITWDADELVQRVKALCRSSPEAKSRWCTWCDSFQGGTKDPTRMETDVLVAFFQDLESGGEALGPMSGAMPGGSMVGGGAPKAGQDQPDLAEAVKVGQRCSQSFKAAWVSFCTMKGQKTFDPTRHTKEFLVSYFDHLGACAMAGPGAMQQMPTVVSGKRARTSDVNPDPNLPPLAEQVKMIQRADPLKWQLWAEYCDAEAQGTKDPMLHTVQSLRHFLTQCQA
eukprot:CAMPEP_0171083232 /NCGR_PEP_ID=MMETSP0766_2-20121228/17591_1 /TAXON_ID=439317 /ORGANISM="Gambierdiscus australes, Strain CAWD 149" /LENGTH=255 /DNA_ID=CAMNT_0011540655 /DNA_START=24 /DNA_END=788 /DNA_ORIENTATION=+